MYGSGEQTELRDPGFFRRWAQELPAEVGALIEKATFEYIESDDTIRLVVAHDMDALVDHKDLYAQLVDHIRMFYDEGRKTWLETPGLSIGFSSVPRRVVMPRVAVQVAPTRASTH